MQNATFIEGRPEKTIVHLGSSAKHDFSQLRPAAAPIRRAAHRPAAAHIRRAANLCRTKGGRLGRHMGEQSSWWRLQLRP